MVDRDNDGHAKGFQVLDMAAKVRAAGLHRVDVFSAQIGLGHAAVHLHRAHGGHDHDTGRCKPRLAAFDVQEFFSPQIGPKSGFGHHVICQFQRGGRRNDRVAAVGDIRKGTAVHKGWVVFQRLHKVRLHRVFQQHGHRAVRLEIARIDGFTLAGVGYDHIAKTLLQIAQVFGQTKDRHDLGCDSNVEARFAWEPVRDTAQRCRDLTQGAVIHVDDAPPDDTTQIDLKRVAPVDVVVDHRAQQIVRRGDRVEVARKVQVHFFHRNDLRIPAPRSTALHAEVRSKRCLADADSSILADAVQPVAQTDSRGRLALARGGGVNRCHQDQLAIWPFLHRVDELLRYLCLVVAVGQQIIAADPQLLSDLLDGAFAGFACDLDVGFKCHICSLMRRRHSVFVIASICLWGHGQRAQFRHIRLLMRRDSRTGCRFAR